MRAQAGGFGEPLPWEADGRKGRCSQRSYPEHFRVLEVLNLSSTGRFRWEPDGRRIGRPRLRLRAYSDIGSRGKVADSQAIEPKTSRSTGTEAIFTMEVLYQLSYPGETALQSQNYVSGVATGRAPWEPDGRTDEKSALQAGTWNSSRRNVIARDLRGSDGAFDSFAGGFSWVRAPRSFPPLSMRTYVL
jgi:hypothetical protein